MAVTKYSEYTKLTMKSKRLRSAGLLNPDSYSAPLSYRRIHPVQVFQFWWIRQTNICLSYWMILTLTWDTGKNFDLILSEILVADNSNKINHQSMDFNHAISKLSDNFDEVAVRIPSAQVIQYLADYLKKHTTNLQVLAASLHDISLR